MLEQEARTRNYGCRIRRYSQNGVEMASLENNRIKLVIALGKGADIVEINTIRKRLSAVKGGKFARACAPAQVMALNSVLFPTFGRPTIPSFIVMNSSFLFLQRAARVFLPIIQKEPAGRNARAQNSLPGAKVFFCTHLSVIIEIMRTARGKEVRRHGQ